MRPLIAALLLAAPAFAQDKPEAVVVLADDGDLDVPTIHAILSVTNAALRKHGISVSDDRRLSETRHLDAATSSLASELGARRVFALRISGHLGQKIPLSLEEVAPGSLASVYSASLTAMGLEECDTVTGRLVDAVLERRSADTNAGMRTVTATEAKPFAKKPGERFWFIGLPVALFNAHDGNNPVGFTLGYGYEAENFRLDATLGGYGRGSQGTGFMMLEAAWLPLDGEVSPYFGGGIGYMGANAQAGMGGMLEAGVEAFRLHGVRGLAGLQVAIPFYTGKDGTFQGSTLEPARSYFPALFARLAF